MNNGLTAERMMDSFPLALQKDPKMVALAHSIANVLEQRLDEINLGQIYTRIDQLPEDLLDILAKDFAVDWYDHDYDLAAKRRTIKSAPYIHRHRGTAGAVLRGIRAIYPGSRLEEWWQYGGEPYHFRVMLDMSGSDASYVSTERVLWAIGYYKSLRSHNDGVYYQSAFGIEIVASSGYIVYAVRRCGTFPKTATQGGISAGNIIIVTDEFGGSYAHPRTGQLDAGMFPATATQGRTAASEIEVLTVDNGGAYAPEKLAGTYPETATQGFDDAGYVVVQTADGSSTYAAPASGDLTAGLHPATATSGGTSGGGLVAEESGLGSFNGNNPRSNVDDDIGFRAALPPSQILQAQGLALSAEVIKGLVPLVAFRGLKILASQSAFRRYKRTAHAVRRPQGVGFFGKAPTRFRAFCNVRQFV